MISLGFVDLGWKGFLHLFLLGEVDYWREEIKKGSED